MIEDDFDIKKKVEEVLNETGFTEQRAAKMGVDELLKCVLTPIYPSHDADRFSGSCRHSTMPGYILRNVTRAACSGYIKIPKVVYSLLMDCWICTIDRQICGTLRVHSHRHSVCSLFCLRDYHEHCPCECTTSPAFPPSSTLIPETLCSLCVLFKVCLVLFWCQRLLQGS